MGRIRKKRLWRVFTVTDYSRPEQTGSWRTVMAPNMAKAMERALTVDRKMGWKRCYPTRCEMVDGEVF